MRIRHEIAVHTGQCEERIQKIDMAIRRLSVSMPFRKQARRALGAMHVPSARAARTRGD